MGNYLELSDLAPRVDFVNQIRLADDKDPGEAVLTDQQETTLRTLLRDGGDTNDARLQRILDNLNGVIEDGEARVNSYLAHRYVVPVMGRIDPVIKTHSLTFAVWYLHGRRASIPESVKELMEDATAWGEAVAAGDIALDILSNAADPPPQPASPVAHFKGEKRRLSRANLSEW